MQTAAPHHMQSGVESLRVLALLSFRLKWRMLFAIGQLKRARQNPL
jgi:hypothetical protein